MATAKGRNKGHRASIGTRALKLERLEGRVLLSANFGDAEARALGAGSYDQSGILVRFRQDVAPGLAGPQIFPGTEIGQSIGLDSRLHKIDLGAGVGVEAALAAYQNNPLVEFAEPNWIYTTQATLNDPYYTNGSLWGMYGDETSPANPYGSQAGEEWAAGNIGSDTVYVGIIDEGIQYTHSDLHENVWRNPYDPADGVDNDGNGYVDDIHGWDFYSNNNTIYDGTSDDHGTHVAGTIAAKGGNGAGVAGVNWNVKYISAKFLGRFGGSTADAIESLDYFTDLKTRHGLNIVATNNSWGGGGFSQGLLDAITRSAQQNILFIAAAGNGGSDQVGDNNDSTANYPSNYDTTSGAGYDSVVAVAAINSSGGLASFSNYGAKTVDLGAPGVGIYSTLPDKTYGSYSGTSMATPHVTGAAALYAASNPGATALSIKNALLNSAAPTASLAGKTVTDGRLDVSTMIAPATAPAAPSALDAVAVSASRIDLTWIDNSNNESGFRIERSDGTQFHPIGTAASNQTSYSDTGLSASTPYTYRVAAYNSVGEAFSNEDTATTLAVIKPDAPTDLSATSDGSTSRVNLAWTDKSSNETGFKIRRSTTSSFVAGTFTDITVAANTTAYPDTGVSAGTTYYYQVYAFATADSDPSNTATASTAASVVGTGDGVTGRYYSDKNFSNLKATRTDASVDFNWGTGSPMKGIRGDNFTVRWVGQVQATHDETYTFYAKIDDNVRLWVNGELVLRRWGSANTSEWKSGQIELKAGHKYHIQMDFRELSGSASAYLKWASPSVPKQIIPQSQLYMYASGQAPSDYPDPNGDSTEPIIGIDNGDGSSTALAAPSSGDRSGTFSTTFIAAESASDRERASDMLSESSGGELLA